MLSKSLTSTADTIIYDLEDSVAPAQKTAARQNLVDFLATNTKANSKIDLHYSSHHNPNGLKIPAS